MRPCLAQAADRPGGAMPARVQPPRCHAIGHGPRSYVRFASERSVRSAMPFVMFGSLLVTSSNARSYYSSVLGGDEGDVKESVADRPQAVHCPGHIQDSAPTNSKSNQSSYHQLVYGIHMHTPLYCTITGNPAHQFLVPCQVVSRDSSHDYV